MARWLILLACLAPVACAPAAAAGGADPDRQQWPGGLPGDWRSLGDDEAPTTGDGPPSQFDFGRDGRAQPSFRAPDLSLNPAPDGAMKSPDPAKDAATAKADRARAREEELKKALAPRPEPAALRQRALDELFKHLAAASDPEEAKGFAEAIQRIWMRSRSDTANLIMQRAALAAQTKDYPLALSLLDRLVALEPNWAEAWNQRATARFLSGDFDGSMADIDRVMKLEPRHFGAL